VPPKPVTPRVSVPAWLSWAVREHQLTPATFAVLYTLCELGDREWVCVVSERDIAENVGIARSAVQRALARLLEIHAIVDLGRESKRAPQRFRVSPSQPPTAAQLRLLATSATRRAAMGSDGGWLVSVD
jgi:DNA-binding transcriptional ArsR family regulator